MRVEVHKALVEHKEYIIKAVVGVKSQRPVAAKGLSRIEKRSVNTAGKHHEKADGIPGKHQKHQRGLLPLKAQCHDKEVIIDFNIPCPPLTFDTIQVTNPGHYGFSVITPENRDIVEDVILQDGRVHLLCGESPKDCRVRYAINGDKMVSGRLHGPRGNLRDSQGDSITITIQGKKYPIHNWCYQFDMPVSAIPYP